MFLYKLLYFDQYAQYLGQHLVAMPGSGTQPVREYVKEHYNQEPQWGLTPKYITAVPVDHTGDPVMVVMD